MTGCRDAYDLARYFIEERGNPTGQDGKHYYDWEAERRGETPWKRPDPYPESRAFWYAQAHHPILEQQTVEGHSVRCVYLLTAVADMLRLDTEPHQDTELPSLDTSAWKSSALRLWDNMVSKKMYLTGGIGAIKQWEGFGQSHFLPQGTDEGGCYAETCASIGVMMLAERLLHLCPADNPDRRFADTMELCLYNNVMTAMSLDGTAFTYVNQLASSDTDLSARSSWFEVSCCPPNLSRLFASLGGYLWDYGASGTSAYVNVHLYTTATLTFPVAGSNDPFILSQTSNYPWSPTISFSTTIPASTSATIRLRLPAWCKNQYTLSPAPAANSSTISPGGYLVLSTSYLSENPTFTLSLGNLRPRFLSPHPYTTQHTLSLARGPIVYCAEDVDNPWEANHFKNIAISASGSVEEEERVDEESGEEYVALKTTCWRRVVAEGEEVSEPGVEVVQVERWEDERELVLVPYYFRGNRGGKGHMRVGLVRR